MIKASGFASERFLNMVTYRGIYLWDVQMSGASVVLKAPLKSLPLLEACRDKTGCRMEIISRGGLPEKLRPFHGRQVLSGGILAFIIGIYALSSFIWVIEVEGNERIKSSDILAYCDELGLRAGTWKRGVSLDSVTQSLLAHFPDISWVSVGLKGTDVTIQLAETIEQVAVVDKETPCNLVATMDGVITQITAERGTPLVAIGDVVQKGDVLISSEVIIGLEGEEQHPAYVAADGVVMARIWRELVDELPLDYEEKIYIGDPVENKVLLFGQTEIDVVHPSLTTAYEQEERVGQQLALGDFTLPVALRTYVYYPYEMEARTRTVDEAKTQLEDSLRHDTENDLTRAGQIEEITYSFAEQTDLVRGRAKAVIIERIDQKQ